MFARIFLDERVKRGRAKLLVCKYGLKDTDDLVDGKSVISTSGTELEKAGLATTAAPAPAHRSVHGPRVRVARVATPPWPRCRHCCHCCHVRHVCWDTRAVSGARRGRQLSSAPAAGLHTGAAAAADRGGSLQGLS